MNDRSGRSIALWSLLIALAATGIASRLSFRTYRIPTAAMEPTIAVGDYVIVRLAAVSPRRGDVIVFDYPLQPSTAFAKRVIGLPGETIEIRDKRVRVSGVVLDEPYAFHDDPVTYPARPSLPEPYRSRDQFGPHTIPPGEYFVMGDNRDRSSDSRFWGTVPAKLVRGKVVLVVSVRNGLRRL